MNGAEVGAPSLVLSEESSGSPGACWEQGGAHLGAFVSSDPLGESAMAACLWHGQWHVRKIEQRPLFPPSRHPAGSLSLCCSLAGGAVCSCRGMDADLEALDALTEGNLREIIDSWEGFCSGTESLLSGDLSVAADSDEYAASVRALSHYGLTRLVGDHFLQALEVLPPSPSLSPSIVVAIAIVLGAPRRTLQRKRGWCLPYAHGYLC